MTPVSSCVSTILKMDPNPGNPKAESGHGSHKKKLSWEQQKEKQGE